MASTASTSSSSFSLMKYDVFLSFRGEDTRKTFTDHLYTALVAHGIHTFRDDEELEKGGVITSELLKTIQESRVSVVIFSENYASSRWCLNELLKILESMREMGQIVVPVFYHVDPSDVRNQRGSLEEAFIRHERDAITQEKKEKIQKWRAELTEFGNLSGWHVHDQHEGQIVKDIVERILPYMPEPLNVGTHLVGVDVRLEEVLHLISIQPEGVVMVGIWGLGGVGKSTLAKALYNQLSREFRRKSFLEKVGDASKLIGLFKLQKQLYRKITPIGKRTTSTLAEGLKVLKAMLCREKILLVIDDVTNEKQLKSLAGGHGWFHKGSIIIITSRDKSLIEKRVDILYELRPLTGEEALELFSWHAFNQKHPFDPFYTLANQFAWYCQGLPLALEILGCSLLGKKLEDYWLRKLGELDQGHEVGNILNVLKVSSDGLGYKEMAIFLDIACFFKGEHKDFIVKILDGCGFNAESGIELLRNRRLLTISNGKIDMHNLMQQLGHKIVRDESPRNGQRSRLWYHEDVEDVLRKNTGTNSIQGIFLNLLESNSITIISQAMEKMTELRLLKIFLGSEVVSGREDYKKRRKHWLLQDSSGSKETVVSGRKYYKVHISSDFEFPSWDIRYLHWHSYPLNSLPSNFEGGKLLELHMPYSNITKFGEGIKVQFPNLTVISLSHSKSLIEVSNLSSTPNLEKLVLKGCTSLVKIDPSIGYLERLGSLDMKECTSLRSLPDSICNLQSLTTLNVSGCSELKCLPEKYLGKYMSHLTELYADRTAIGAPPSVIGSLKELQILSFSGSSCKAAAGRGHHPSSISLSTGLSHLRELDLSDCYWWDAVIPDDFWGLYSLEKLNLSGNRLIMVPASISELSKLKVLVLGRCQWLREISKLPPSLEEVDAHECLSLHIPSLHLPSDVVKDILRMIWLHETILRRIPSSALSSDVVRASSRRIKSLHTKIWSAGRIPSLFTVSGEDTAYVKVLLSDFLEATLRTMWLHKTLCVVENTSKVMSLHKSILGRIPSLASLLSSDDAFVEATSSPMKSLHHIILEGISSSVSSRDGAQVTSQIMSLHRTILERVPSLASSREDILRMMSLHKTILDRIQASPRSEFCTLIPGDIIPEWFEHQAIGVNSLSAQLRPDWYNRDNFLGFCVCFVFAFEHGVPQIHDEILCRLNNFSFFYCYWDKWSEDSSSFYPHMCLAYQPRSQVDICHPELWTNIEASFELTGASNDGCWRKCGIQLIYAPDKESNPTMAEIN